MILNILRVDELRVEDMMQKSFSEAAGELKLESMNEIIAKADTQMELLDEWVGDDEVEEGEIKRYMATVLRLEELSTALLSKLVISRAAYSAAFANGRLAILRIPQHLLVPVVILSGLTGAPFTPRTSDRMRVVALVGVADSRSAAALQLGRDSVFVNPGRIEMSTRHFVVGGLIYEVREAGVGDFVWFADLVVGAAPLKGAAVTGRITANTTRLPPILATAAELGRHLCATLPSSMRTADGSESERVLLPLQALSGIAGAHGAEETLARWAERDALVADTLLTAPSCFAIAGALWSAGGGGGVGGAKARTRVLDVHARREALRAQVQRMRASAGARRMPELLPEYRKRVAVLQKMQYVGEDGVSVLTKGRHGACEVATVDSVLLTEIVLDNVLIGLSPAEIASLLSALVCRKKNSAAASGASSADDKVYSAAYLKAKAAMRRIVREFGAVQQAAGVELEFEIADAADSYEGAMCRWALSEVVLRWAEGAAFANVIGMTDLQEGDVVVTVKRLVELLKDARGVAVAVGNEELAAAVEDAVAAVKRDIIFSGSLYLA